MVVLGDLLLPELVSLDQIVQRANVLAAVILFFGICLLVGRAIGTIIRGQAQILLAQAIGLGQVKQPEAANAPVPTVAD